MHKRALKPYAYTARTTGWLLLITGLVAVLSIVFLLVFAVGFLGNIPVLYIFGGLNDLFGALVAFLSAILALTLFGAQRKESLILSLVGLIAACIGAVIVILDSGLGISGVSLGLPSRYDLHFGTFLIGIWLFILIFHSSKKGAWPKGITNLGLFSGLGLSISMGLAGTPAVLLLSIPYPIWCIRLGRWILTRQMENQKIQ